VQEIQLLRRVTNFTTDPLVFCLFYTPNRPVGRQIAIFAVFRPPRAGRPLSSCRVPGSTGVPLLQPLSGCGLCPARPAGPSRRTATRASITNRVAPQRQGQAGDIGGNLSKPVRQRLRPGCNPADECRRRAFRPLRRRNRRVPLKEQPREAPEVSRGSRRGYAAWSSSRYSS
jgi:hypothetical protein